MKKVFLILALLIVFAAYANANPQVWVADGMDRVWKSSEPKQVKDITLYAAKGEYEPFQVVVKADENGLKKVNLAVSDLVGVKGAKINSINLARFREFYVNIQKNTPDYGRKEILVNHQGPGLYPDALIPFIDQFTNSVPKKARFAAADFDLSSNDVQPYLIDIFVPRNTKAGKYEGTYTISSEQGSISGKIILNVWNFSLPLKPSERSFVIPWSDLSLEANILLAQHKLMSCEVPAYQSPSLMKYGFYMTDLRYFSGAYVDDKRMSPPPSVETIKAKTAGYPKGIRLLNWTADEIDNSPELNDGIKNWARNLHAAGAEQLLVAPPIPELFDDGSGRSAVDVWAIQNAYYESSKANVNEAIKRGMEVWSYTAINQDGYAPKWLLDFAPINYRVLQGYLNQSLGYTGILYWACDYWLDMESHVGEYKRDPWLEVSYNRKDGTSFPGEGSFVYPGADVGCRGTVPSMRLKWIREGIEDYEYVELLKKTGQKDLAIKISKGVASDWKNWSKNPDDYQKAKFMIGKILSKG